MEDAKENYKPFICSFICICSARNKTPSTDYTAE